MVQVGCPATDTFPHSHGYTQLRIIMLESSGLGLSVNVF